VTSGQKRSQRTNAWHNADAQQIGQQKSLQMIALKYEKENSFQRYEVENNSGTLTKPSRNGSTNAKQIQ